MEGHKVIIQHIADSRSVCNTVNNGSVGLPGTVTENPIQRDMNNSNARG